MNKIFITTALFLFSLHSYAQQYGNEWINFNQTYFKIKVIDKGIYRLSSSDLANAGIPIAGINPKNLQIFNKGVEQHIYVSGEADNSIDAADYLEFWGKPNDGKLDSTWYITPNSYPHSYTSLYTDTNVYYLTWSNVASAKRFDEVNGTNISGTPENYFIDEKLQVYNSTYHQGLAITTQAFFSDFTMGEGFFSSAYTRSSSTNLSLITEMPYTGAAPAPSIEVMGFGESDDATALYISPLNHHVTLGIGQTAATIQPFADLKFSGYNRFSAINSNLNIGNIGNGTTLINISVPNDMNLQKDNNAIAYIKLKYARQPDLAGGSVINPFTLVGSAGSSFLRIQNFGKSEPILYDFTNKKRILGAKNGSAAEMMVANGGSTKRLYLFDKTDARSATLSPVSFININPANNYQYLIVTHDKLMPAATNYKNYRQSAAGGGYSTLLVTTQQLYDQFSYGTQNPAAIRNFAKYMIDGAAPDPKFLLLAGKAYNVRLVKNNKLNDNLVPTVGDLASDNLLTYNLTGNNYAPAIPTGRIDARNNGDLQAYLNKVQVYETRPGNDATWQKDVLQISGGTTSSEKSRFDSYLNLFEGNLAKAGLGANAVSVGTNFEAATTMDIKQFTINEIAKGKLILDYYGHGTYGGLTPDLGAASDYPDASTNGKFPFMYISGCNVGDSYVAARGFAEEFTLEPNKGAIAILAQSSWGFESYLKNLGDIFSRRIATDNYGATLGEVMKNTLTEYVTSSDLNLIHAQQYTLHGDPAIKLASYAQADLKLQSVSLMPHNTQADTLVLSLDIDNFGKGYGDSISVSVSRTLPNGTVINYPFKKILAPTNAQTINYTIIEEVLYNTAGNNQFSVLIDAQNVVSESNEANNAFVFNAAVRGSSLVAVSPTKYSIVGSQSVALVVQNTNLLSNNEGYVFEIDTVPTFNSPYANSLNVNSAGSLVSTAAINLPFDQKVYYWRARLSNSTVWDVNSSFIRKQGTGTGWSQAHTGQYSNNTYDQITYNSSGPALTFSENLSNITARADGYSSSNGAYMGLRQNRGLLTGGFGCGANVNISVFTSNSLKPTKYTDCTGNLASTLRLDLSNAADMARLEMLLDTLPSGSYIAVQASGDGSEYLQNGTLPAKFANFVANPLFLGQNPNINTPYVLIAQKGNLGFAVQDTAQSMSAASDRLASVGASIKGVWSSGSIISEVIGAAQNWTSLDFSFANTGADVAKVDVIGIDMFGQETVLFRDLTNGSTSLSSVSAATYPYLKLRASVSDATNRTPPQLKYWQVLYEPIPETSIVIDASFEMNGRIDSIRQGDSLKVVFKFKNTSNTATDPLNAKFIITKNDGTKVTAKLENLSGFAPNEERILSMQYPTLGFGGRNALSVDVLPSNLQRELILPNNEFDIAYLVESRFYNPTPVTLSKFEAKLNKNGDQALLHWVTVSEINNDYFEIERRLQTESGYKKIGKTKGAGNTQTKTDYNFIDDLTEVKNGKVFYRLKQYDYDGRFEYSAERSVDIDKHLLNYVHLYPNPSKNNINIEIQVRNTSILPIIQITDLLGKPINNAITLSTLTEGSNVINIPLENLPSGLYYMHIILDDDSINHPFIITK